MAAGAGCTVINAKRCRSFLVEETRAATTSSCGWSEEFDDHGTLKTRRRWKCRHCSKSWVYTAPGRVRRHLSAGLTLCKSDGGVGCCHKAPEAVRAEFRTLVLEKLDTKETEVTRKRVRGELENEENEMVVDKNVDNYLHSLHSSFPL